MKSSFLAKFYSNPRLLILFILLLVTFGIFSFINIPRVLNPSIDIAIVNVSTILPGASPEDVESLVTIPIEEAVTGLEDVKEVTSTSRDSISIVTLEFESGTDSKKARDDVSSALDNVTLPDDAQNSRVQELDFQNEPVWSFSVTSKEDKASLVRFVEDLKDKIDELPEVREVVTSGLEETEVQIILKPEAISSYGLNPQILSLTIKNAISAYPAGNVKTEKSSFALTIDPQVTTIDDIRNLKIDSSESILTLENLTIVQKRTKPDQTNSYLISPKSDVQIVVNFDVFKTKTAEIEEATKKVEDLVSEKVAESGNRYEIKSVINSAEFIKEQFDELLRDFWITVSLVFLTLLIFLGFRQALVSAISIPLTFFFTFTVMRAADIDFSFIAFFSLLLSLGLLVDDTIVVISAMTSYYREKKISPLQAGLLVWKDFLIPIFTTTLTTVWAFVPLLLASGIIGAFIKPIPIVVSTTLLASFIVAMFITLPLMIVILKPFIPRRVRIFLKILAFLLIVGVFYLLVPKTNLILLQVLAFLILLLVFVNTRKYLLSKLISPFSKTGNLGYKLKTYAGIGFISFEPVTKRYSSFIGRILNSPAGIRKTVLAVVIFFIFSVALFPLGFVKNEFFPSSDEDYLYVSLEMPAGTNIETTEKESIKVLQTLKDTPGMEFATLSLGRGLTDFGLSGASGNNALISIRLLDNKNRKVTSSKIAQNIREKFKTYTPGKITVTEISGGPPAGEDLQIKLFGPDLNKLNGYAEKIQDFLKTTEGVSDIDKSIKPGTSKITFIPDQVKISQNNLSLREVGFWLRTYASGFETDSVKFIGEEKDKDITIRLNSNSQFTENLGKVLIPSQNGNVPLISLGELRLEANPTLIARKDSKRTLSVLGSVAEGFNIQEKNRTLEEYADSLNLPPGYGWETGGVNEENQNSINSILQAMILSFLLIVVTMVIQFSSFRDALIVMLVIPLAVSGVFIIFALTRTPLSFPALIGVLALFGIVVKNSILLVDKINQNKKLGIPLREAIANASSSRIEPIFLTSFATIIGLIPITLSNPLWRGLGGAIIAGLTFSGTIMLLFIPIMYYLFFRGSEKVTKRVRRI